MPSLPPKLYFRIGEVSSLVGVEPHVLRYWEREFRSIRPTKSTKGQRVYSRRDVENLIRVRELLYSEGFTIAGAKKKLQRAGAEPTAERERAIEALGAHGGDPRRPPGGPPPSNEDRDDRGEEGHGGPESERAANEASIRVRTALVELRGEIEAFLAELGG
jgi:DNA-binding transcriptional MerR regulator